MTGGYKEFQGVTSLLQGVARGARGLQVCYNGLQGVATGYRGLKGLQWVTGANKELQGGTSCFKG